MHGTHIWINHLKNDARESSIFFLASHSNSLCHYYIKSKRSSNQSFIINQIQTNSREESFLINVLVEINARFTYLSSWQNPKICVSLRIKTNVIFAGLLSGDRPPFESFLFLRSYSKDRENMEEKHSGWHDTYVLSHVIIISFSCSHVLLVYCRALTKDSFNDDDVGKF